MDENRLRRLLAGVRRGTTTLDAAIGKLKNAPFERLGDVATIDTHRTLRVGMPEVVLAEAKTAAQVAAIARKLAAKGPLLVTRLTPDKAGPARRAVRGSGRACVERLVAHAGSVALATRFVCNEGGCSLEGLILVMPEPERIAKLLSHLDLR